MTGPNSSCDNCDKSSSALAHHSWSAVCSLIIIRCLACFLHQWSSEPEQSQSTQLPDSCCNIACLDAMHTLLASALCAQKKSSSTTLVLAGYTAALLQTCLAYGRCCHTVQIAQTSTQHYTEMIAYTNFNNILRKAETFLLTSGKTDQNAKIQHVSEHHKVNCMLKFACIKLIVQ